MHQVGDLVRYTGDAGLRPARTYRDGRTLRVTAASETSVNVKSIVGEHEWRGLIPHIFEKV